MEQVANDGLLAIIAGFDTKSATISALFWCLLNHPTAYQRLQDEVDALRDEDVYDVSTLARSPYLNAAMYVSTVLASLRGQLTDPLLLVMKLCACFRRFPVAAFVHP